MSAQNQNPIIKPSDTASVLASMNMQQLAVGLNIRGAAAFCISTAFAFFLAGLWRDILDQIVATCRPRGAPNESKPRKITRDIVVASVVTILSVFLIFALFKFA